MGQKEDILLSLVQGNHALAWAMANRGWDGKSPLDGCGWEGIKCDPADYTVISIVLPQIGITGTIPPGLALFTNLATLDFFGNRFVGTIPPELLTLPNLAIFNVAGSGLEGHFPLFKTNSLNFLNLADNGFRGVLPRDIGKRWPALMSLNLANNTFEGTLPSTITMLTNLDVLNVANNQMIGTIPDDLRKLVHLKGLFLNHNKFIGTLPRTLANTKSKLIQIYLQHNALSGTIPANLAELPQLVDLFVDGNKLTGTVPPEVCNMHLNKAYFAQLAGAEARGGCESVACPINSRSTEGVFPCEACPSDRFSPYLGHDGNCIAVEQKHILDSFFNDANGPAWIGAARWGNPNVPVCMYEGIDCDESGHVVNITLRSMNLQGTISFKLGRLYHMRRLNLADNMLTGEVPSDLRFAPLEHLDLSGNQLESPLPPLLCLVASINGNGAAGHYSCDIISCPSGTWHYRGYADPGGSCMPCIGSSANFIGQRSCGLITFAAFENMGYMTEGHVGLAGVILICFVVFIILLAIYVFRKRNRDAFGKAHCARDYYQQDSHYKKSEGKGDGDRSREDEYADTAEELTVMSFVRHASQTVSPNPSSSVGANGTILSPQPSGTGIVQRRRDHSPDDDPDTQDLWLDVPKIA